MKCEICGRMIESIQRFGVHVHKIHGLKSKEYYDEFLRKDSEGECEVCGKPTGFLAMSTGYRKTCSTKCSRKTKSYREKIKRTNLERYGVENPFASEKIKEKIKRINLERHGVENPGQIEANKDTRFRKTRATCVEKYGTPLAFHNEKGKRKSLVARYEKLFARIDKFTKIRSMFDYEDFKSSADSYQWKCLECGELFMDNILNGKTPECPECYPKAEVGSSLMERELQDWLASQVGIKRNHMFSKGGTRYELDVYVPSKKIGIEFDGLWWHSELAGKNRRYHLEKTEWFEQNFGIRVIHVFESEWVTKRDIVESILMNKLGLSPKRVYARKCEVYEVQAKESAAFLEANHLQGRVGAPTRLGLRYRGGLVSLMTFGKSRFGATAGYELVRFCNALNTSVVGGFSKLLKAFDLAVGGDLVSYCDRRYSTGSGYARNGFEPVRVSPPNYWYFSKNSHRLNSRLSFQKHRLPKLLETFDPGLTEWENMVANGWNRIWDCGNLVFVRPRSK